MEAVHETDKTHRVQPTVSSMTDKALGLEVFIFASSDDT
jgi:hypothetical protein